MKEVLTTWTSALVRGVFVALLTWIVLDIVDPGVSLFAMVLALGAGLATASLTVDAARKRQRLMRYLEKVS